MSGANEAARAIADQIAAHAGLRVALVEWHDRLDSTNRLLCERAREGAPHGSLIDAGQQSAGRGRGDKSFFSPPEGGLYFSLLLRKNLCDGGSLPVTPRAALAVRRVLLTHGVSLGIKWVNDLFRGGRKACGILCQAIEAAQGPCVVVGIGLNLYPAAPPPDELAGIIGYCAEREAELPPRALLTGEIAAELLRLCALRGTAANAALLEEYRGACVLLGRRVEYGDGGRVFTALAEDITPTGGLVLRTPEGERKVLNSGTVRMI